MKRTLSLLLVLVMVITMVPSVFAETASKPGIDFDEMLYVDNYSPISEEFDAGEEVSFIWTATEAGVLTYEVPASCTVTLSQGENTAVSADGIVSLEIVADEDVTITVTNTAAEAARLTLTGTLVEPHVCEGGEPVVENKVEATCTTGGSYDTVVRCTGCGKELSRETTTEEALGHDYKEEHFDGDPGYTVFTCSRCGDNYQVDDEIEITPLVISKQPKDVLNAKENGSATFTVEATGQGTLTYQWQESTDSGNSWSDIAGATSASYKVSVEIGSLNRYRCVVTDETGATLTSNSAGYDVLHFTLQPVDAGVVYPNTWITLSVEAVGGDGELEYRWQKRRVEEGAKWTWTGSYGATAEFKTSKWTHYEYRCRAMDGKYVYIFSDAAGWTKKDSILTITEEPVYVKEVKKGEQVTFEVKAESDCVISYVWYRKNKGKDEFTATSLKEASFTVTAQTYAEHEYYCVVTDEHGGRKQSKTVSFRTRTKDLLFPDLEDAPIAKIGEKVTYDATATSYQGSVTYRWQKSTNGGETFSWTSSYDPVYTITSNKTQTWYRCMITDGLGVPYYTDWVSYYVAE